MNWSRNAVRLKVDEVIIRVGNNTFSVSDTQILDIIMDPEFHVDEWHDAHMSGRTPTPQQVRVRMDFLIDKIQTEYMRRPALGGARADLMLIDEDHDELDDVVEGEIVEDDED